MLPPWFGVVTLLGRLTVEAGTPDALCPDLATTEQAIGARLGALETEGAAKWRLRYTNGHAPNQASGDFVRIELYDPENKLRLTRDLPMTGESCATMAQAIALVVDRFFRDMIAGESSDAPPPPTKSEPTTEPHDSRAAGEKKSEARELVSFLKIQGGIVLPPVLPTVGLAFATRVSSWLVLGSSATWVILPRTEELDGGGEAELRSATLRISLAGTFDLGGPQLAVGPTLAYSAERGSTKGLPESASKYRSVFSAGVDTSLQLPIAGGWGLDLMGVLEVPFRPFGGDFVIDGEEVLETPSVRAWFAVGVGPMWFR
jgi:hypothetical protein